MGPSRASFPHRRSPKPSWSEGRAEPGVLQALERGHSWPSASSLPARPCTRPFLLLHPQKAQREAEAERRARQKTGKGEADGEVGVSSEEGGQWRRRRQRGLGRAGGRQGHLGPPPPGLRPGPAPQVSLRDSGGLTCPVTGPVAQDGNWLGCPFNQELSWRVHIASQKFIAICSSGLTHSKLLFLL